MNRNAWQTDLLPLFPKAIADSLRKMSAEDANSIEEIRLRVGRPVQAIGSNWERFFNGNGACDLAEADLILQAEDCALLLDSIAFHSIYAMEEELRRGCITLPGGYRVGLSGRAVLSAGRMERLSGCTFFSFRIAREQRGCAETLLPVLLNNNRPLSTLILSPPGCGKTTYLRDIARLLADGGHGWDAQKVCIADERSEIAGCCGGVPQNDVGLRCDVLDGCPKAEAMEILLRALSPNVLITDEIGREDDFYALQEAANAGVVIMASAHAGGLPDLRRRPLLRRVYDADIFERYVFLGRIRGPGSIIGIYDAALNAMRSGGRR